MLLAVLWLPGYTLNARAQEAPVDESFAGWFSVISGDAPFDGQGNSQIIYVLRSEDGRNYRLEIDDALLVQAGGVSSLNRQFIRLKAISLPQSLDVTPSLQVTSLAKESRQPDARAFSAVSGSQPWVSIMCKFNDVSSEPKGLSYFQNMYANEYPGLDHYWRESSYNLANVNGSTALGWYTLPQPRSYYVPDGSLDFARAANDCTAAANASVYFPDYVGINLMFNDNLDGYAWGGTQCMTLDGVFHCWSMTWEPPWGYDDITVIAHEMGHGFGLPHSSGAYGSTYDNEWDVMSDGWSNCSRSEHPVYGCLGQHTIAYHKDSLGWILPEKKYTVPYSASVSGQVILPDSQSFLMAKIPVLGSNTIFYTVEVRIHNGYDIKLPGEAVIIHQVDTSRSRPANVVDIDLNYDTGDAGAMWVVGETFQDATSQISVSVIGYLNGRYQVQMNNGLQEVTLWLEALTQPDSIFGDVSSFHWAYDFILKLYNNGITGGCAASPLMYCPESSATRAEMAIFLLRGIHGSSYTPPAVGADTGFSDVPVTHWAAAWIKQLATEGITGGCGAGLYCPEAKVTRDQMAVFLLRAKYGSAYTPPAVGTDTGFSDVPVTHWAAAWIKQLAAEGITGGCANNLYCPGASVTRAQMAVFLVRAFNLP